MPTEPMPPDELMIRELGEELSHDYPIGYASACQIARRVYARMKRLADAP